MFEKVVVGFDGSEQAHDALALARVLTAADGEIVVCCVHRFKTLSARVDPTEPRLDQAAAERCVGEAVCLFDEDPRTVSSLLVSGAGAGRALQTTAAEQRAHLLVLGSSHRGALGRLALGSVTEEALHGAPCPVAVAPVGFHGHGRRDRLTQIAVGYDVTAPAHSALAPAVALARGTGAQLRLVAIADPATARAGGAGAAMSYRAIVRARLHEAEEAVAQALAGLPADIAACSEVRDGPVTEKLLEVTATVDLLIVDEQPT